MARTILEIAQEAAERDATAPAPSQLFGVNNRIARILRLAAKDTFREYLRMSGWQGMSEVHSTWTFALKPGIYAYELPPDFLRIIPRTEQRNGWPMGLIGPASPQAWSEWLYGGQAVTAPMGWRIRNNVFWVDPTPATEELVCIDYVSKYPVVSDIRDGDFDLTVSPPMAVAPVVPRDGYITLTDANLTSEPSTTDGSYDEEPGYDNATWPKEASEILKRINVMSRVGPLPKVRRPEFTADTDKPAFEDDFLLSLGMTFRLRRGLGLPFAEHAAEYESEMEVKASTDAGGSRSFRIGSQDCASDVVPLGDGSWMVN